MVKHSRFAKTAKVFPLECFDVYGISNCTKKALISDTTSRSHCVDVFIVHRSIDWCRSLGNKQVITQVHSYYIFVINTLLDIFVINTLLGLAKTTYSYLGHNYNL